MKKLYTAALLLCSFSPCFAQLTQDQKVADFLGVVGLYDKNYGPYEWKKQAFNFDLLKIQPWLDQVYASRDDLAFYDVCVRYVASLHDFHDEFTLPSFYEAYLPLTADIYDGKVLVDYVDQTALPPASFPIAIGDQLVAVDGISAATWMNILAPYSVNGEGNPVSRDRLAVATMLDRYQAFYTYASKTQPGQMAKVAITGAKGTATYSIPWSTIFLPLFSEGPVPNPNTGWFDRYSTGGRSHGQPWRSMRDSGRIASNFWGLGASNAAAAALAQQPKSTVSQSAYRRSRLRDFGPLHPDHVLAGGLNPFGSSFPLFNPPTGFKLRLNPNTGAEFLSGTFPVGKSTVGFIRIPSFDPNDEGTALAEFASEIAYFQANTNGLVIDLMGNGGGNICYGQSIMQYLVPTNFRGPAFSLRATENWIEDFEYSLYYAEVTGAPQSVIDEYTALLQEVQKALAQNRGMTKPLPLCTSTISLPPATDSNGNNVAYTKPILVLTNNFSASAAEIFGATLQDAKRITVYGTRTSGGGGNVVSFNTAPYAEGSARATASIAVRTHNIATPGLPSAPYIENIGVYPDILADFQTKANLLTGGQPFVAGFTTAISQLIASSH